MADYTSWTEKTSRKYYAVSSPSNFTELSKAMTAVTQDLKAKGIEYWDDTVTVEAWDDQIRFSYIIKEPKND